MCPELLPTDNNFTSSELIVWDFPNKMSEKSCVLKAEIQPEWYTATHVTWLKLLINHRLTWSIVAVNLDIITVLIIVQWDATQNSLYIILQVRSTCFGCQSHPLSGVYKTVTTAYGTVHNFCAAPSLQCGQLGCRLEAVVKVLCTPDDGCGWRLKHVEWTCRIINRLLCVASRWTVINTLNAELNPICHLLALLVAHHILHIGRIRVNIDQRCTEP